jgi:hypothetical protein
MPNFKVLMPIDLITKIKNITRSIALQRDGEYPLPKYPVFVERLMKPMATLAEDLHHAGSGMGGEGGEISDITKKCWVYGKPLDVEKMIGELGDLRFYYQAMLNLLQITDEDIQAANMVKLMERFPNGYTDAAAIARADVKPNPAAGGLSSAGAKGTAAPAPRAFMGQPQAPKSLDSIWKGKDVIINSGIIKEAHAYVERVTPSGLLVCKLKEGYGPYKVGALVDIMPYEAEIQATA